MSMRIFLAVLLLCASAPGRAAEIRVRSGRARARLIELFSSEGCSSCPPADAWVSSLRGKPGLWSAFVPVAFHVTYWDDLGWPDRLADKAFTARQRAYAASWGEGTTYTPGFVLDGAQWRGWGAEPPEAGGPAGVLEARESGGALTARFSPAKEDGPYVMHAARLGFGVDSKVAAGENAGRTLRHDFVALALAEATMKRGKKDWTVELTLPAAVARAPREGLAVWVTGRGGRVAQAAGGGGP